MWDDGYYITEDGIEEIPEHETKNVEWKFIGIVGLGLITTLLVVVPWVIGVATIVLKLFF